MSEKKAGSSDSYMKELGMGNNRYILIDIDHADARITLHDAVKDVVPFEG